VDAAVVEPSALEAVTRTRRVEPASAAAMMYAWVVAPPMTAQSEPSGSPPDAGQRTHWNANPVGLSLHVPWVAVSVEPTVAVPDTAGSVVLTGAAC
jgi:hypothetical protein